MIAVIFEAWPSADGQQQYLDIAAALRPLLDQVDGFISIERFQSLTEPSKVLSLSFFRDEAAITAWRNSAEHRTAQAIGRAGVFSNYRLRIAETVRDYGLNDRAQGPADSQAAHGCPFLTAKR
jgi:heme-degrading monooxygenase HmoA